MSAPTKLQSVKVADMDTSSLKWGQKPLALAVLVIREPPSIY